MSPTTKTILAIESSCDDTSVAVLQWDGYTSGQCPKVLGEQNITQRVLHEKFGGIVPENASRAHLEVMDRAVGKLLEDLQFKVRDFDEIVVTATPGLLGSLLVGVSYAEGLSIGSDVPLQKVHHLAGHLAAPFLVHAIHERCFPALGLVVSGGHTQLYRMNDWGDFQLLGETLDDAIGECFDKTARVLGLGFPGGPELNRLAESRWKELLSAGELSDPVFLTESPTRPRGHRLFPRPRPGGSWNASLNMSFSGLKTAVALHVEKYREQMEAARSHWAFEIHESIGEVLVRKVSAALDLSPDFRSLLFTGGVAANSLLRTWLQNLCRERQISCLIPPLRFCTDNAAMIGMAGLLNGARSVERRDFHVSASTLL